jgi:hypothetical protein
MDVRKSFSRRSLGWILFFMLIFAGLVCGFGYWLWQLVFRALPSAALSEARACSPAFAEGMDSLAPWLDRLQLYFIPSVAALFFFLGLILWLLLRGTLKRRLRKAGLLEDKAGREKAAGKKRKEEPQKGKLFEIAEVDKGKQAGEEKEAQNRMNQRYYLHLLSVLQREGRLVDFFEEDLGLYEDAQIGAAVRNIQDACKKTVKKHLSPKPVFEKSEGESVTIPADFDPAAVKLTGNVTGDPPFTGVLRHRGWRAAKLELPSLGGSQDPRIIAPAEVEIS